MKWWDSQSKWDKCYTVGGVIFLLGLAIFVTNIKNEVGIGYSVIIMIFGLAIFAVGKQIERKSIVE